VLLDRLPVMREGWGKWVDGSWADGEGEGLVYGSMKELDIA